LIAIFKKDLANYYKSPIAYVTTFFLLLICGFLFYLRVLFYNKVSMEAMMNPMYRQQLSINEYIIMPIISTMAFLLLFFIPLFTMRLFSEEKKMGTLELLFTYPLSEVQLIMGKFLSCSVVVLMGSIITLSYPLVLSRYAPTMDWSNVITGYLGILLLTFAFIALGMWISSLTDSQIVAAFSTFGALLMFWIIGLASQAISGPQATILTEISILDHFDNFTKGVLDVHSLVFFLSFIFLFLYLTYYNLLSRKWRG
jgi:ABC-2 type transport system permease protein